MHNRPDKKAAGPVAGGCAETIVIHLTLPMPGTMYYITIFPGEHFF